MRSNCSGARPIPHDLIPVTEAAAEAADQGGDSREFKLLDQQLPLQLLGLWAVSVLFTTVELAHHTIDT